jgi:hypothetical protein
VRLPSLAWYALLFCLCLLLGGWAGVFVARSATLLRSFLQRQPAPAQAYPANDQRNLLVVGVDRLEADRPRLESLWLVLYFPGRSPITLLPLYPAPAGDDTLPASFALAHSGDLSPRFQEQLRSQQIWWHGTILMDEAGMAAMLDFLSASPGERRITGAQSIERSARPWHDPAGALLDQTALLQVGCDQAAGRVFSAAEVGQFLDGAAGHLRADLDLSQVAQAWLDLAGEAPAVRCEFPLAPAGPYSVPYP